MNITDLPTDELEQFIKESEDNLAYMERRCIGYEEDHMSLYQRLIAKQELENRKYTKE